MPETFELCTTIVRAGCGVANVGVHGHSATLHLETQRIRDITITTGLVDTTTTQLLKLIEEPEASTRRRLRRTASTRRPRTIFAAAAETHALKVVPRRPSPVRALPEHTEVRKIEPAGVTICPDRTAGV